MGRKGNIGQEELVQYMFKIMTCELYLYTLTDKIQSANVVHCIPKSVSD